jgi:hypothetical protein
VSWDQPFAEPIMLLEDGVKLATLRDAIAHLATLIPKAERNLPEILTASDLLTNAAEHGGPVEFARIATLQAINRHVGRVFDPSRKDMRQSAFGRPNDSAANRREQKSNRLRSQNLANRVAGSSADQFRAS